MYGIPFFLCIVILQKLLVAGALKNRQKKRKVKGLTTNWLLHGQLLTIVAWVL